MKECWKDCLRDFYGNYTVKNGTKVLNLNINGIVPYLNFELISKFLVTVFSEYICSLFVTFSSSY